MNQTQIVYFGLNNHEKVIQDTKELLRWNINPKIYAMDLY